MPFKIAEQPKCKLCAKSVYVNDKQVNFDGLIYHQPCSKCKDCGCNVTVSNFAVIDEDGGVKTLLCKVHYKERFTAAGGVYAGSSKYSKQSERESVSKDASDRRASVETVSPIKASSGTVKDTYTLERSVTTPDRRPSAKMPAASVEETAKAPEIMNRRASLKSSGNSIVSDEIAVESSRTADNTPGKGAGVTATGSTVFTAAEEEAATETPTVAVENLTIAAEEEETPPPAVEEEETPPPAVEEEETPPPAVEEEETPSPAAESCCGGGEGEKEGCAECDCGANCTACCTDECKCSDTCACKQGKVSE